MLGTLQQTSGAQDWCGRARADMLLFQTRAAANGASPSLQEAD